MTAQIAESVSGMAVIQAFNRERAFLAEFDAGERREPADEHARAVPELALLPGDRVARRRSRWRPCSGSAAGCSADGSLTIGTLVAAVFLLNLVFQPLQELSDLYGQVQSAGAAMEKITTVLDDEPEIHDEPGVAPAPTDRRRPAHRPRHLRLRQGAGAARDRHPRAGRRLPRARRRVGRRQVDDREARRALLRPRRRRDPRRRPRPARARAALVPPPARRRAAGPVPVRRHDRRQHPLRAARGDGREVADVAQAVGVDRIARRFDDGAAARRCARAAPGSRPASAS